jgi:hypothetical protein
MHIYFKRHTIMVDKIMEQFSDKQLFITDHSGILIDYVEKKYVGSLYDLEDHGKYYKVEKYEQKKCVDTDI